MHGNWHVPSYVAGANIAMVSTVTITSAAVCGRVDTILVAFFRVHGISFIDLHTYDKTVPLCFTNRFTF